MSFSFDVKDEIAQCNLSGQKSSACLYGMLLFAKNFCAEKITLQTENLIVAELFTKLVGQAVHNENSVSASLTIKKNNISLYSLCVDESQDRENLLSYFDINNDDFPLHIDIGKIGKKKYINYFIDGVFMVCGSINNPKKEYHLEFVAPSEVLASDLIEILSEYSILAKLTKRKNSYVVYIKESENIEDLLTLMGACKSTLEIMNIKIVKDMRNKVNRVVNCDSANIEKALKASENQINNIKLIESTIGISSLPPELQEISLLRLNNPEWNLKEISQNLDPPISRSGANHRFERIAKIAENL